MKRFATLLLAVVMLFSLVACAPAGDPTPAELNTETLQVAVICSTDDEEQADSEAAALLKQVENVIPSAGLKKKQITLYTAVSASNSAIAEEAIEECIWEGCAIIFGADAGYETALKNMAKAYPRVTFIGIGEADESIPNYYAFTLKSYDGAYFCGLLDGARSKSGKLGIVVANGETAEAHQLANAYLLGARVSNPNATVTVAATGTAESVTKEQEAVEQLWKAGCDALFITTKGATAPSEAKKHDIHISTLYTNHSTSGTEVEYSVMIDYSNVLADATQAILTKQTPLYHNAAFGYADGLIACYDNSADREVSTDPLLLIDAVQSLMLQNGFDPFSGVALTWELGELKEVPTAVADTKKQERIAASAGAPSLQVLKDMTWFADGITVLQ